ncbi:MAG: metallophosphoesterase, partial [Fibrobacterota bacterium]
FYTGNYSLKVTRYTVNRKKPKDGTPPLRICHISDLHNKKLPGNQTILRVLKNNVPDIVAITGDAVNHDGGYPSRSLSLIKAINKKYPVYFITGNHEFGFKFYEDFIRELKQMGVRVLNNEIVTKNIRNTKIFIGGIADLHFYDDDEDRYHNHIKKLQPEGHPFILLAHNPQFFPILKETTADLILSGHTHGGQFRLPSGRGLFAPGQGFFPEYDSGRYVSGQSTMIVSRGIGPSTFPFRIMNRPEIAIIELV